MIEEKGYKHLPSFVVVPKSYDQWALALLAIGALQIFVWCDESSCKSSCLFALLTTCYELLEEIRGSQESLSSRLETPFVIVCELSPECKYFWLTSELWLFLFSSSFPSACLHLKGSGDSQPNFRQLKQTFFFFQLRFRLFGA